MKADVSIAQYHEGHGTRYIRSELIPYGTRHVCTNEHEEYTGSRVFDLWVSDQFGDGYLRRSRRFYNPQVEDSEQGDRMTRQDVSMWLPIVTQV